MIQLTRGELLESAQAIESLGKVYLPVGKDQYWFIKYLSKIQKMLKYQNKITQDKSNEIIKELGIPQPDGRLGITPADEVSLNSYRDQMENFMHEEISIDIHAIEQEKLAEAKVTLIANEQVSLMWLIKE